MKRNDIFIKSLISKMDLDQKVGSLLTLGFSGTLARPHIYEAILKYNCGGLRLTPGIRLFGSYVDPKSGNRVVDVVDSKGYKRGLNPPYPTASGYKSILDELKKAAASRPLSLPLHFSFDQEGGTSADFNFGGVNIFPKPMGLRATGDPGLAYRVAKAVCMQSRAVGFNWIHSPVLDINVDPENPEIYTRAYSDRVEDVIEYAEMSCRGFRDGGLVATGKHFPGRGASAGDAHFEIPVVNVDKDTLLHRELLPYQVLFEKGLLPAVMVAHSVFPAIDGDDVATVSKKVVTGLLREKLQFDGVICTDSMTMGGIALRYGVSGACVRALEAGADLVLLKAENGLVGETFHAVKHAAETGEIGEKDLDEKVGRVLSLKYEYGMFYPDPGNTESPETVIRNRGIVELSRLTAKKSVLVARDRKKLLPLTRSGKILVIEQIGKTPNDLFWHPALLYENCARYNGNADYLETTFTYDPEDRQNILDAVKDYDTIVITSYYLRGRRSNVEFISRLLQDKTKNYVVVTNTPYRISIPDGADTVVLTFATSPRNIESTAGTLFGEIRPEGEWPLQYRLPLE